MQGRRCTLVRRQALDSLARVALLTPLRPHVSDHLVGLWDGSPIQKGPVNTCFAEGGATQMHLEQRPP